MEYFYLDKSQLNRFIETLRRFGKLHGPALSDLGVTCFAPLPDLSALQLNYRRTLIPPKKYLFPFRDHLLQVSDGVYRQPPNVAEEIVLFALHPCDLDGIAYLDRVFLEERPDPLYRQRRERLTLVGLSCEADDFCFCSGNRSDAPCDLFLAARGDGFRLSVSTGKGAAAADAAKALLAPWEGDREEVSLPSPIAPQDPELRFSGNPLWEKFAQRCVSCGACSVCCPTCYCFDVREYPGLACDGKRIREWDNCFFVTHGEVSGANFRPTRLDRLRYRFLHKYCGFTPFEGMTSCVGCGRCRNACPVEIDLRELLETRRSPELP